MSTKRASPRSSTSPRARPASARRWPRTPSQIPDESFFLALPDDLFAATFGTEWFIRLDATAGRARDLALLSRSTVDGPGAGRSRAAVAERAVRRPRRVRRHHEPGEPEQRHGRSSPANRRSRATPASRSARTGMPPATSASHASVELVAADADRVGRVAGRGRTATPKYSAMARSAKNPDRTHSPACGSNGQVDRRQPQRRGVEHRARWRSPTSGARRGERKKLSTPERGVRLLQLGEPELPRAPRGRRAGGSAPSAGARQDRDARRRLRRSHRELRHEHLAARERAVDRREVRDEQGEERQARRRLEERERWWCARSGGRTNPSVNSDEPLISNARSNPRHPEGVEHRGERADDQHHPDERQHEQADRRVERHHPVAAVVACGASRAISVEHRRAGRRTRCG